MHQSKKTGLVYVSEEKSPTTHVGTSINITDWLQCVGNNVKACNHEEPSPQVTREVWF